MNTEHLKVARGLLDDAAFFWRLSKHDASEADREVGPARAERARRNARAAFALLAIEPTKNTKDTEGGGA